MNCPKCSAPMERVTFDEFEVDRCTKCEGIWFDMREMERLKDLRGSEAIDTGNARAGEQQNPMGKINCPTDGAQMIRMVDARQPHLWYEKCPVCYGVYLDAGEFRDYKAFTLADFIRDLRARERK